MTPQEKATQLIEQIEHTTYSQIQGNLAKQCIIILVDEIIKVAYWQSVKDYWVEVKAEIENYGNNN